MIINNFIDQLLWSIHSIHVEDIGKPYNITGGTNECSKVLGALIRVGCLMKIKTMPFISWFKHVYHRSIVLPILLLCVGNVMSSEHHTAL